MQPFLSWDQRWFLHLCSTAAAAAAAGVTERWIRHRGSRTFTETSTKSRAILLRRSLSLEKRAVGRDAVIHGSGYLPPAEFSLRLSTNSTPQSPSCGRPKFTFTISTWLERSKSEGAMSSLIFLANFCKVQERLCSTSDYKHWCCERFGGLTQAGDLSPTCLKGKCNASHSCSGVRPHLSVPIGHGSRNLFCRCEAACWAVFTGEKRKSR